MTEDAAPDRDELARQALRELPDNFGPQDLERLGITLGEVFHAAWVADEEDRIPMMLVPLPLVFDSEVEAAQAFYEYWQARLDRQVSGVDTEPWADAVVREEDVREEDLEDAATETGRDVAVVGGFHVGDVVRNRHTGATLTVTEPLSDWSAQYYEPVTPDAHASGAGGGEPIAQQGPDPWRPAAAEPAAAAGRVVERDDVELFEPDVPDPDVELAEQVGIDSDHERGLATGDAQADEIDAICARVEQLPEGMVTDVDLARVGVTPEQFSRLADASAERQAEQWRAEYATEQEWTATWRARCAVERAAEAVRELHELADAEPAAADAGEPGAEQLARWHVDDLAAQEALRESDRVLAGEVLGDA